jgi:hypothetical protein
MPRSLRECSNIRSTVTFKRGVEEYGDTYYLVVRCESGWAAGAVPQQFAIVVERRQTAEVQLYERVRQQFRL